VIDHPIFLFAGLEAIEEKNIDAQHDAPEVGTQCYLI
jgi:hypothetical protein